MSTNPNRVTFIGPLLCIIGAAMSLYGVIVTHESRAIVLEEAPIKAAPDSHIVHNIGGAIVTTTRVTIGNQCFLYATHKSNGSLINVQQIDCAIR